MQGKKVRNKWPKAKNEKLIAQRLIWCRTEGYCWKSKEGLLLKIEKGGILMRKIYTTTLGTWETICGFNFFLKLICIATISLFLPKSISLVIRLRTF